MRSALRSDTSAPQEENREWSTQDVDHTDPLRICERERDDYKRLLGEFADAIHEAIGDGVDWQYRGQLVRDVESLREQRDSMRAEMDKLRTMNEDVGIQDHAETSEQ